MWKCAFLTPVGQWDSRCENMHFLIHVRQWDSQCENMHFLTTVGQWDSRCESMHFLTHVRHWDSQCESIHFLTPVGQWDTMLSNEELVRRNYWKHHGLRDLTWVYKSEINIAAKLWRVLWPSDTVSPLYCRPGLLRIVSDPSKVWIVPPSGVGIRLEYTECGTIC